MKLNQIKELFEYQKWANRKLEEFIKDINHEDITRNLGTSFCSIQNTYIHILGVEELWLSRWLGEKGRGLLNPAEFSNFNSVSTRWIKHNEKLESFIESLSDNDLKKEIPFKNIHGIMYSLELWKQMLHVTNHSSYHRGQIVTMIRQLNLEPPSFDLVYYYLGIR